MTSSSRSFLKEVLYGFSWVMVVIAGLSFFIGGTGLQEFARIDRLFAEIIGIAIAFLCGLWDSSPKTLQTISSILI